MSIPCVLDFASKAARRDVEEQAASAQTTDLVEDATKASERAVGVCFRSWTIADCGTAAKARESTPALGRIWPQPDKLQKVAINELESKLSPWQVVA